MKTINLLELEELARARLDGPAFDYIAGGAQDEVTLRANHAAWERLSLRHRVLVDVSETSVDARVLGRPVSMPVLLAPVAFQALAHDEAEVATVRAAGEAGTVMILSTLSSVAVEDVAAAASGPVWFQLYVQKDRRLTARVVDRAMAAGCAALVVTVDAPRAGRRERDLRNAFQLPEGMLARNLLPKGLKKLPRSMKNREFASSVEAWLDPSLNWKDLEWLRSLTDLPLVLKGIGHPDDAARAAAEGVDAIVVSNHGGRQLDGAPATADVLAGVVDAAGDSCEVYVDGGVRRGTDVVKALALGATAVLIGRPFVWGLALDGQAGVGMVLETLREELDLTMALCGCTEIGDIGSDLLG